MNPAKWPDVLKLFILSIFSLVIPWSHAESNLSELGEKAYSNAIIDFWGKVVDENNQPISGAKITYEVEEHFSMGSSPIVKIEGVSDENGLFELRGKQGGSMLVNVFKDGYYRMKQPYSWIPYWARAKSPNSFPTKEKPAVYILKKKGIGAALVHVSSGSIMLKPNGESKEVNIATGRETNENQGDLKVRLWMDSEPENNKKYDWKCEISVRNGGLAIWKGDEQFDFEAPSDYYRPTDQIILSKSDDRWNSSAERKYFVKTADGKYAKIEFSIIASDNKFFSIWGYYNPSGSRNLEYDPKKKLVPR